MLISATLLSVAGRSYYYYSLSQILGALVTQDQGEIALGHLPFTLKIFLENVGRTEKNPQRLESSLRALLGSALSPSAFLSDDFPFRPSRVLMQDFTGVPALVDLAALRETLVASGGDPNLVNPRIPTDLVVDHSVMVDFYGAPDALSKNLQKEFQRNSERYQFLKWSQKAFKNLRVIPPGRGICHQINLEYLAQVVGMGEEGESFPILFPDTLVGTDSHTTMVNGLSVLGWGVGGIEAEAAMLGQPLFLGLPRVVGVHLKGALRPGRTATDLVLTITQLLRQRGVVGKFVEFYGEGLETLSLPDRATVANMAPEYGATTGFFPIDAATLNYLLLTGRSPHHVEVVETYAKAQGLWHDLQSLPFYRENVELDLSTVETLLAGPRRPQEKVLLRDAVASFQGLLSEGASDSAESIDSGAPQGISSGDVVIAAITSCTNTSNPSVMIGAGLLARAARARGLSLKPWVKASLAPGSRVVTDYLEASGLGEDLAALGFHLVGYGCTTCIGNSGPLAAEISQAIAEKDLTVCAVLSGNRNFEGRIHPLVKASYLMSPPLVVAYGLAGTLLRNLETEPLGHDEQGVPVYLRDIWPSPEAIEETIQQYLTKDYFLQDGATLLIGSAEWDEMPIESGILFPWNKTSTYLRSPPLMSRFMEEGKEPLTPAHILALLGDGISTDHISPAGNIPQESPAGQYLQQHQVALDAFNSYGSRRGNHEVMVRGTFANTRLRNELVPHKTGGWTLYKGEILPIFEASLRYQKDQTPLVIVAGKDYGCGSSRDWAAKGTRLLGVVAVVAESFERIHRTNLIGLGVLPLEFLPGETRETYSLTADDRIDLSAVLAEGAFLETGQVVEASLIRLTGQSLISLRCRLDTPEEVNCYQMGGIFPAVLKELL